MRVRYYCFLIGLALTVLCTGCGGSDVKQGLIPFSFTVDYDLPQQTIPGDPLLWYLPAQPLPDIPIDLKADEQFNSQYFHHITSIKLESLVLTIDPGSAHDDWSFLVSADIWIKNPDTSEEILIAYIEAGDPQLDPGNAVLLFNCLSHDITERFTDDYRTTIILRVVSTVPPADVTFNATAAFRVSAVLIPLG